MQVQVKQKKIYKVGSGDTLSSICQKFKVEEAQLLKLNGIDCVKENMLLLLPPSYSKMYVVQPLDTYEKIAHNLGVSVEEIKQKTKGKNIFIGQKIFI